jgi:hypothetical protein
MSIFGDILGALATPPIGRNRRISSNEQPNWNNGNFDMTRLAPGETFQLPELEGPGVITHIWMTSHSGGVNELDSVSLRIYWDDRKEPAVEVPLGEFFAVGQGRPAAVESLPVQVSPTGALTCYWRMPFAKSARITVTNDNLQRSTGLYWQVDWLQLPELPPDTPYFYARYRQEYPAQYGRDYLIADIEGRGKYVGTVLSVTLAQDGWFGEGDDFFYIDGEEIPSLQGTGSEDYFNDAWGFRERSSIWFGQPRWQGWRAGDSGIAYRWHVLDPVGFQKSLKVTIEHKGNREPAEDAWYIERPDFFSSIAYWYQLGEPKPFGYLPPWPERRVPWQDLILLQQFRKLNYTGSAKPQIGTYGFFGGRPVIVWPNHEENSALEIPFTVSEEGRYALRLIAFAAPNYGTFDIYIDDNLSVEAASFAAPDFDEKDLLLGTHILNPGEHKLSFRALPNGGNTPRPLVVEKLRLLKLPPEAVREVKGENEAHFVRGGIGRAVYAYRLAYGELPESLEVLVQNGIMDERYLRDENGAPLRSRREGDQFVVESTAPGGWRHVWRGLDARR